MQNKRACLYRLEVIHPALGNDLTGLVGLTQSVRLDYPCVGELGGGGRMVCCGNVGRV